MAQLYRAAAANWACTCRAFHRVERTPPCPSRALHRLEKRRDRRNSPCPTMWCPRSPRTTCMYFFVQFRSENIISNAKMAMEMHAISSGAICPICPPSPSPTTAGSSGTCPRTCSRFWIFRYKFRWELCRGEIASGQTSAIMRTGSCRLRTDRMYKKQQKFTTTTTTTKQEFSSRCLAVARWPHRWASPSDDECPSSKSPSPHYNPFRRSPRNPRTVRLFELMIGLTRM